MLRSFLPWLVIIEIKNRREAPMSFAYAIEDLQPDALLYYEYEKHLVSE